MCELGRRDLLIQRDELMDEFVISSFNLKTCMYVEKTLEDYCNKIFDPLGLEIFKYTIENSVEGDIVPEQELTLQRVCNNLDLEQSKVEIYLEWMKDVHLIRSEFIEDGELTIYRSDELGRELHSRFFEYDY
jgi:hypothetical protein